MSHGLPGEVETLLAAYPDDASAAWNYNWALYLFKYDQGSPQVNKQLNGAIGRNKHIPDFLLKRRRLPRQRAKPVRIIDVNQQRASVQYEGLGMDRALLEISIDMGLAGAP